MLDLTKKENSKNKQKEKLLDEKYFLSKNNDEYRLLL